MSSHRQQPIAAPSRLPFGAGIILALVVMSAIWAAAFAIVLLL